LDDGKGNLSQFPGEVAMVSTVDFPTKRTSIGSPAEQLCATWQGVNSSDSPRISAEIYSSADFTVDV